MNNIRVIGLTGGIGSGKSTVADMFAEIGVPVLDLDAVGHALLDEPRVQTALLVTFGASIQNKQGAIDRRALAAQAFANPQQTKALNAIMHPEILRREQAWITKQSVPYVMIEASVLLESGGVDRMDGLIVVIANEKLRKLRVLSRGKQNEAMFERIKQRQCEDAMRYKYADHILKNEGTLESLNKQVLSLSQELYRAPK
ncbi:MAG: dephospho-CoA kinase [Mariprofundaceae bacterium]|nr:dephospho-CoA kinase [Mariprofundaceae bacterium]